MVPRCQESSIDFILELPDTCSKIVNKAISIIIDNKQKRLIFIK